MPDKNSHVKEFIDYYCNLDVDPEYALLIVGSWGSGKSHLVQDRIAELNKQNKALKFLYVSLYGITCTEDIETKFFQLLNPILSSKKMVLAGRIAKAVLRGSLKIDLDGNGKHGATAELAVPSINLADYMTDTRNYILVFDDLERCTMDLNRVLGYINYFVEKEGYKVILIADEDKLTKPIDDSNPQFSLIKEKLIGKTLTVEADIEAVFGEFLKQAVKDDKLRRTLTKNKIQIIQIFEASNYNNLRSLRKTLMDFDRLWQKLPKGIQDNHELISSFLKLFTILSIEIYSGSITHNEIHRLIGHSPVTRVMREKYEKESDGDKKYKDIENKYETSFFETLIDVNEWKEIFSGRGINEKTIIKTLKLSKYFSEENTPDWIKLWHLYELDDDEFDRLFNSVKGSFDSLQYQQPGEIKHVSGILLKCARELLIPYTVKEVNDLAHKYIDKIFLDANEYLSKVNLEDNDRYGFGSDSYAGLGYFDKESDEFEAISSYLNTKIEEVKITKLANQSNEILEAIQKDPENLYDLLCHSNYGSNKFYSKPVLQFISEDAFIELVIKSSNRTKIIIVNTLLHRYEHNSFNATLKPETEWLESVSKKLEKHLSLLDQVKPSTLSLRGIKINLDNAAKKLRET